MNRSEVLELMNRKDSMVAELDKLLADLDEQGVGMNRTLTTFDGYPRDDVDIPLIRSQRQKVYMLQNDIKQVLEQIRVGLAGVLNAPSEAKEYKPFCYVAEVQTPKGLELNDQIVWFGDINETNNNGLRALPGQLSKQKLRVVVLRDGKQIETQIAGGKLGCRVMPL